MSCTVSTAVNFIVFLVNYCSFFLTEMTENWSNETIMEFLNLYEKYPVIWDPQNVNHKNRNLVFDAWAAIANEMSVTCTIETLKKKKESLMATYRGLKKRLLIQRNLDQELTIFISRHGLLLQSWMRF